MIRIPLLVVVLLGICSCSGDDGTTQDNNDNPLDTMAPNTDDNGVIGFQPCDNGLAGPFPCNGYDLLGGISLQGLSAASGNDIWGWTDTVTGREYALVGLDNGTAFVDITDTDNLTYLGKLPTATNPSTWRDIKVYNDHAFIVSEANFHGMQVFDLTRLRNVASPPVVFDSDARYTGFGNAHNVVVNEDSGFGYAVGTARDDAFNGGVHFLDLADPKSPTLAGGYGADGYSHDAQVVTYNGPDMDYQGREIYIGANENQITIVDVTDKEAPTPIATLAYDNLGYTHQGWFTEDHRFFILGDETDEIDFGFRSRTLVFDFSDLDLPVLHSTYLGPTNAIDHNGYVKGNQFFLANYTAGVRILDISNIAEGTIVEEGFFDTFPQNDIPGFSGAWSAYPYFESGKIIIGDMDSGLLVIQRSE